MTEPMHGGATPGGAKGPQGAVEAQAVEVAWTSHLLRGGVTPWQEFRANPDLTGEPLWHGPVPGAQNLEVVRRLNARGPLSKEFARRVMTASLPGRGKPDLRLIGGAETRWGHPSQDPATLPASDLLRVVSGVLAQWLVDTDLPPVPSRTPRRWARQFELRGDPWATEQHLEVLRADGRVPGGPAAHVVLLAGPLDQLVAAQWAMRAHREPVADWSHWLNTWRRRDGVPGVVDLPAVAARAAAQVSPRRVHVVLDTSALPKLVGRRTLPATSAVPSGPAADLARHVSTALVVRADTQRRHRLLWEVLRPRLAALGGSPLQVPEPLHGWLTGHATRMIVELSRAGYAVHGDLSSLLPGPPAMGPPPVGGENDAATLAAGEWLLGQLAGADMPATNTGIGE